MLGTPAKLVGCLFEEFTNYPFGHWTGELWIGEARGVRFVTCE